MTQSRPSFIRLSLANQPHISFVQPANEGPGGALAGNTQRL